MYLDLLDSDRDVGRNTEICIIGAGVAGITLARRLLKLGHEVMLLESGGRDYEAWPADLNGGDSIGAPYYGLGQSRLRFFGGTTAIWGGRLAELDPIDLERRAWVAGSGWPIDYRELSSYYADAWPLFGQATDRAHVADLRDAGVEFPDFDPALLASRLWAFDGRYNRFVFDACSDLRRDPRCTVVTHATVTDIAAVGSRRAIASVTAKAPSGRTLIVYARAFILAAGGLENPRLLLNSRGASDVGLGNDHDQVGRYFMEHPHARGGRVLTDRPWMLLRAFGRPHMLDEQKVAALVTPSERFQADEKILNTSLTIVARRPAQASQPWGMRAYGKVKHDMAPTQAGRSLWMTSKRTVGWLQRKVDPLRPWLLHRLGIVDLALLIRAEQAPNPASRVRLSDASDALGQRRLTLDWRFSDQDKHSVERLVWALDRELRRLDLGRVEPADWLFDAQVPWRTDALVSAHPYGGYHHMGTTRMGTDARTSVTAADTSVHGIGNLFVAGSSLFPTSGWANPTLTIAALALRTADTIHQGLRRTPASAALELT
jgi:choline dehydrogenase-like flavoprotein